MRSRNIKPSFFSNEDLGAMPPLARLFYEGLWCAADREGRLENRPLRLKAQILPYDSCDVIQFLALLEGARMIKQYESAGRPYIQVIAFREHQRPHHTEKASTIPPAPADSPSINTPSRLNNGEAAEPSRKSNGENPPDSLIPDSLIQHPPASHGQTDAMRGGKSDPMRHKSRKSPDSRVALLITDFFTRLETKLGEKPKAFNGGAAGRIFRTLLKDYPPEKISERMQSWFDSSDPFIVKNGWRIELFNMHFNTLKGGPIHGHAGRTNGGYIGAAPVAGKYAALANRPKHS